ncbi:MAG: hypothetical protein NZ602_05755 [Thermoguttaceae bacterium]|nr:hypothetical protein [Thermoguttaceae bacterium]MDW8037500.1 hypothetical protein [Thermoguttaceae bacterium]
MDARRLGVVGLVVVCLASLGASARSRNFIVHTADSQHAVAFAQQAEKLRRELAIAWLGQVLPDWSYPCPITATVGPHLGAGGATSFVFDRGEVYGWRMTIQGSYERILDSVLPHEITHMIFASYFRRPLPRWADEGAASTVENETEKAKHRHMLLQFLRSNRGIPFDRMFAMSEYPADILPLYAQAYALAEYLIQLGGRRKYVDFVADGLNTGRWADALHKHYGIPNLQTLQNQWVAWVGQGFPALRPASERMVAGASSGVGTVAPGSNPSACAVGSGGWATAAAAQATAQPSAAPLSDSIAPNAQVPQIGSSLQLASTASTPSQSSLPNQLAGFTQQPGLYRPGSTARPGIIWSLPLVPLHETSPTGGTRDQAGGAVSSSGPQSAPAFQAAAPQRHPDSAGDGNLASLSARGPDLSGQSLAQTNSPLPANQPDGASRSGSIGVNGWLAAGSRPLFAPGSVGKALAQSPLFQPLASSGAVDRQLTRPQMPESAPTMLGHPATTAVR